MINRTQNILFKDLAQIIEQGKQQAVTQVNSLLTLTYWHVGKKINDHILNNERAEYGKQIVSDLAQQLEVRFGKQFTEKNLRRMMRFAEVFSEFTIVAPLVRQLSWSHFITLLGVKSDDAKWSKREYDKKMLDLGFYSVNGLSYSASSHFVTSFFKKLK